MSDLRGVERSIEASARQTAKPSLAEVGERAYHGPMAPDDGLTYHEMAAEAREEVLARAASALASCERVRLAWAYGSFLSDRPFGDIDIGVQFYGAPHWDDPGDVARRIWEAIGRPPWDVDVVPLNDATAFIREKVADEGCLLFEREPGEDVEFEGLAATEVIELAEWKRIQEGGG